MSINRTTLSRPFICCILIIGGWVGSLGYCGGSQADYDRAAALRENTHGTLFGLEIQPLWLDGNQSFFYRLAIGLKQHRFMLVDTATGCKKPAFDHATLAAALTEAGLPNISVDRLPLQKIEFDTAANCITFDTGAQRWQCDLTTYQLEPAGDARSKTLTAYLPETAPKTSRRRGNKCRVTFVNRSEQSVTLFWLDETGNRIPYGSLKPQGQLTQSSFAGHLWLIAGADQQPVCVFGVDGTDAVAVIGSEKPVPFPKRNNHNSRRRGPDNSLSPDGQWQAFIKDNNLGLRDRSSQEEIMLTTDGTEPNGFIEAFDWSPDSKKLVAIRRLKGDRRKVHFVESSPKDQFQPKLHTIDYPKPGDAVDMDRPCLFDITSRKQIAVANALFATPYHLHDIRWRPDSAAFTFIYNQRGHQVLRLIGVDAGTGKARAIITETSDTFICYSRKYFCQLLDDAGEVLWMSERDGWNHLYLYDAAKGQVKNQVTRGQWAVRDVEHVDTEKRQIWFRAGGVYPEQDPYYIHHCRVNFDGSGFTVLTEGNGTHTVQFSPDRTFFMDTYSRVNRPPVHELRRADNGDLVCELGRADWSALLKTGWQVPEPFAAKGRDNQTDIYGVIFRPTNFDPNGVYPVIENIYAGPHGNFVPKEFNAFYWLQELAELGFVVVKIDGMGTSNRSKKFHDVCWKNLADAGLPDRIAWIKAAAEKYPYMDTSRVGIYGTSAGGQNAAGALMTGNDFYKVAVADCGCHDNRMDKIWWNEQWMGYPVGPEYEANSNITLAKNLQGKLMLIVGEMDKNVDPASTMQLVDALIKADKDFDLLVIPGRGHGAGESTYGRRRQADFFVRGLLGVEPRH